MTSNLIPVTLIGGYLGSGKTTLVNHLLRENQTQKIAVLVNDFGDLAIDAQLIESTDDNIVSLNGGCVCCSYGNDLSNAILDVMALQPAPDHIVIEASGVALPGAIASSLSLIQGISMHGVVIMTNVETIQAQSKDRFVGDTIQRQLDSADFVVLNKIDLIDDSKLHEIQLWMRDRLPDTKQICTVDSHLHKSILLEDDISKTVPTSTDNTLSHASLFHTFKVDVPDRKNPQALAELITQDQFQLVRAKGFVKDENNLWTLIQVVGRRWKTSAAPPHLAAEQLEGGLVCIGLAHTRNDQTLTKAIMNL